MHKFIRRGIIVGTLGGMCALGAGPAAYASTTIQAYGLAVTGGTLAVIAPTPLANLTTPSPAPALGIDVPGVLDTGTLTASVTQGATTESSTGGVEDLSTPLLGLLLDEISATAVTATCSSDASGTTGSVDLTDLSILGTTEPVSPAANTTVGLAGLATITLNQQITGPNTGELTVNAVDIQLLAAVDGGANIVLGSATCGPAPTVAGSPLSSGKGLVTGIGLLAVGGVATGLIRVRRRQSMSV